MGSDGLLKAASAAIKASLAELGPDVRFGLVAYSSRAEAFGSALIPATPENVQRAAAWLDGRRPEGGSRHLAGLQEGVWLRPDVVFMLTDADDLDEREVKSIANLVRNRAHLRVALFGERQTTGETPLGRLVRELGARVQYVGQ